MEFYKTVRISLLCKIHKNRVVMKTFIKTHLFFFLCDE